MLTDVCSKFIVSCLFSLILLSSAIASDKVALVIGNGNYQDSPLNNAINDAKDMAAAFQGLGFEVILKTDINRAETLKALREFSNRLDKDSTGVFYYSGHAVQYQQSNYLLPLDSSPVDKLEPIQRRTVPLTRVLEEIELVGNASNILILDACRLHPKYQTQTGISPGLAKIVAPAGTLIAYSTTPGKIARDGKGRNSPYTKELKQLINTPNLLVEQLFKRVREAVMQATDNQQVPSEQSYLRHDVYFAGQVDTRALAVQKTERLLEKFRQSEAKKRALNQQQVLKTQLRRCKEYEQQKKLSSEGTESALSCYLNILDIDADNEMALARLASLERRYLSWAEGALRQQNWDKVMTYVEVLSRLKVKDSVLSSLKTRLQQGKNHQQENRQIDSITDQLLNQKPLEDSPPKQQSYWQTPTVELKLLAGQDLNFFLPVRFKQLQRFYDIKPLGALPTWLQFDAKHLQLVGKVPTPYDKKKVPIQFSARSQTADTDILTLSLDSLTAQQQVLSVAMVAPQTNAMLEIILRCLQASQTQPIHLQTVPASQALAALLSQRYMVLLSAQHLPSALTTDNFLFSAPLIAKQPPNTYLLLNKQQPKSAHLLKQFNRKLKDLQQQGGVRAIQQRDS